MARKNPKRRACVDSVRDKLAKMNYGLVGKTSAVQICRWTKNSLRGDRGCWKEKFYGISSSGCVQMSPSVMWCENKCLHCWRPIEMNLGTELPVVDDPVQILDGIIVKRRKMLQGMKGNEDVDRDKFDKNIEPKLFTMSLSGEATLYPRLGEMFAEIRRRGAVSFLVTNGLNPSALRDLKETGLPTQLVISCNAPNEELFLRWHRSSVRDAWIKFGESLDVMKSLKGATRRVVRLTLVKAGTEGEFGSMTNMSKVNLDEYVELIKRAEPDFVHVKGYKAVGFAKERMGYNNQVWHEEVLSFSKRICKKLGSTSGHDSSEPDFEVGAEDDRSCVVALKRIGVEMDIEEV